MPEACVYSKHELKEVEEEGKGWEWEKIYEL